MKWFSFIIVCTLILPVHPSLSAQSPKELFSQANELYRSGKFQKAQELYQQISPQNALTEYNAGNCAYRLKQYAKAMLHWKRAEQMWGIFNRSELLDNIQLLEEKLHIRSLKEKRGYIFSKFSKIKQYSISLIKTMPLLAIQLLFLALWLFLFIYLRFLYKKRQQTIIRILFILIASTGIILIVRYTFAARQYGIVMHNQSQLRSGPGNSFQVISYVPEAKTIIIKGHSGDYFKVKVDRQIGWIAAKNIEKV